MGNGPTNIFLHIQKTAGTAIRESLVGALHGEQVRMLYPGFAGSGPNWITLDQFRSIPEEERSRLKYLIGHLYFGIHAYFPKGATYFTFVREPMARLKSQFWQHRIHVAPVIDQIMGCPLSEVVNGGLIDEYDNLQTRMISGSRPDLAPIGAMTEKHLNLALDNLDKHFGFVGTVENISEDWPALLKYLNLRDTPLSVENVTSRNRELAHIDDDADYAKIDWVKVAENNRLDILLYDKILAQIPGTTPTTGRT